MLAIGKILLVIVLIGLILLAIGALGMRLVICRDIRQDPLFPFNPETSFDEWIAYKKTCRDPIDWLGPLIVIGLSSSFLYTLVKKREED